MRLESLTLRSIRARAVLLKLKRPIVTLRPDGRPRRSYKVAEGPGIEPGLTESASFDAMTCAGPLLAQGCRSGRVWASRLQENEEPELEMSDSFQPARTDAQPHGPSR